jgi:hypothetical protein
METGQTTIRLRASALWIPGVLAVILGAMIHTHVASLRAEDRAVAEDSTVCRVPVDLAEPSAQAIPFMSPRDLTGTVRLVLATSLSPGQSVLEIPEGDDFPDNAISQALGLDTFEVRWEIRSEDGGDCEGVISRADLRSRIQGGDIRYVFGDQTVELTAGREYELLTRGTSPSTAFDGFAPTLVIEASSPLKGHPLAGWRFRDTGLLLLLGASLISLGVSKRYSDRKRRRTSVQVPASLET